MGIQINGQTDSISATDGSLTVSGADIGSVVVAAGTTAAPSISPSGDSNTGIFFPSPDTIAFAEGGVEALRVTSSGDIGIGTATPSNYFSYDLVVKSRQNTGGITIAANSTSDTNYLMFADGTSGNAAYRGYINYVHSDDSLNIASAGSVRATLTSTGNLQIANGNLVFSTAGTGIDFSATSNSSGTMTSELLSDYEEGTWTPTLQNTGAGTPSYQYQEGNYTKIGRYVIAQGIIGVTNSNTLGSGSIQVSLPFSSGNGNAIYGTCGPVADGTGFTNGSFNQFGTMVGRNLSVGGFVTIGTSAAGINYNQPASAWYIRFNFMYDVS